MKEQDLCYKTTALEILGITATVFKKLNIPYEKATKNPYYSKSTSYLYDRQKMIELAKTDELVELRAKREKRAKSARLAAKKRKERERLDRQKQEQLRKEYIEQFKVVQANREAEQRPKHYLFFDTETDGLKKPRLVQLGAKLVNKDGIIIEQIDEIVKPEGFYISHQAVEIHGISTEHATKNGVDIKPVLAKFHEMVYKSDAVVAHNIGFDMDVMLREFKLNKLNEPIWLLKEVDRICTMEQTTGFCAIEWYDGRYKWPTLSELYRILFKQGFPNAHNAMADVNALIECFFELNNRNDFDFDKQYYFFEDY